MPTIEYGTLIRVVAYVTGVIGLLFLTVLMYSVAI